MIRPSWTERKLQHQIVLKPWPEDRTTLLFQLQTCSCWNRRCFVPDYSVVSEYALEDACIGYIQNNRRHFWPKFIGMSEMEFEKKASPTLITTSEQMALCSSSVLRNIFQFIFLSVSLSQWLPCIRFQPTMCPCLESYNWICSILLPTLATRSNCFLLLQFTLVNIPQHFCYPIPKIVQGLNRVANLTMPPVHHLPSLDIYCSRTS